MRLSMSGLYWNQVGMRSNLICTRSGSSPRNSTTRRASVTLVWGRAGGPPGVVGGGWGWLGTTAPQRGDGVGGEVKGGGQARQGCPSRMGGGGCCSCLAGVPLLTAKHRAACGGGTGLHHFSQVCATQAGSAEGQEQQSSGLPLLLLPEPLPAAHLHAGCWHPCKCPRFL